MIDEQGYRMGRLPDHLAGTCTLLQAATKDRCGLPASYRVMRSTTGKVEKGYRCINHAAALAYQLGLTFPPGLWEGSAA